MLHGVDRDRDDPDRPFLAGPHQGHRYRQRVVDQHVLAHRNIELVGDEPVDHMPRQSRIALDRARYRNAPAFVLIAVFARRADREGRHFVEKEIQPVVVVENHGDVGLLARQPIVHVIEAAKERFPIRIVLLFVGNRLADRGNVGCRYSTDDPGHCYLPASASFALNSSTVTPVCCAPMSCTLRPKMPASLAR